MAEALVSIILQQLASVTAEGIRLIAGSQDELQKLSSIFLSIQAVLNDAEKKQVKENSVRLWLDKLQDTAYDIDDVLDEWNTMIGKSKIFKEVDITSKLLRKVRSLIPYNIYCCMRFNPHYEIAIKIKDLNRKLDVIALEKDMFNFSLSKGPENLEREMTTSDIDLSEVCGTEYDKGRLVSMLLSESSEGSNLAIISVLGAEGVGKTALAQAAFNDPQVIAHFEERIWVSVSDPFDEIRIAKAILESLSGVTPSVSELESLLGQIRQSLEGRKFLLILDDVWIEDSKYWEKLKNSLKYGSQGSRILVTTRKELTARAMGTTNFISIGVLTNQESWSLFRRIALSQREGEEVKILEPIGKEIVDKCKGFPLAIKTLGLLLRFKQKIEEWERVLGSELWELEGIEKGIFPPLLLSYYDLPFPLRKCFSYCAIFPKDYDIKKVELIKLWMAQGYFKAERSIDIELVGERYFEELAMRSFFQDFVRSEVDNSIVMCKMHDIVHDFAQFISKNECFTIETNDNAASQLQFSNKKARHLMIVGKTIPISTYSENKMRSFIVKTDGLELEIDLRKLFDQLTCLRTLNLSVCSIDEIPSGIKNLMHLRYLNLSQNMELKELPEELCYLYNLQTLDLFSCGSLEKLPEGIDKLVNLRHLINDGNDSLRYMPRGMEKMTNLRTLDKLVMSGDSHGSNKAYSLDMLKNLNNHTFVLEGLGNVSEVKATEELKSMKNLVDLRLSFDKLDVERSMSMENQVILESLQPPPNLEKLSIEYYEGKTPCFLWIESLTNLRELKVYKCSKIKRLPDDILQLTTLRKLEVKSNDILISNKLGMYSHRGNTIFPNLTELTLSDEYGCESLPPLGNLLSLESLRIRRMKNVKQVGNEILGIELELESGGTVTSSSIIVFPKLKYLQFVSMDEWEEWNITKSRDEGITIMPCLQSLYIHHCPKLKYLRFEWEEWDITKSRDEGITIMPCLQSLTIRDCPKLKALPDHILQSTTLRKLYVYSCSILYSNQLGKLSYKGNTIFPNMTELTLSRINSCESLPRLGNLLSLESLTIGGMKNVKQVGNEILGNELELESGGTVTSSIILFPKLKYLQFESMDEWEEWNISRDEGITIMPCLQSLTIHYCPKLKAVPDQILRKQTLQTLEIHGCPILERRYQK